MLLNLLLKPLLNLVKVVTVTYLPATTIPLAINNNNITYLSKVYAVDVIKCGEKMDKYAFTVTIEMETLTNEVPEVASERVVSDKQCQDMDDEKKPKGIGLAGADSPLSNVFPCRVEAFCLYTNITGHDTYRGIYRVVYTY